MIDLPPLEKGDSTLAMQARHRAGNHALHAQRPDTRTAVCPYCGRTWMANSASLDGNSGRVMGFLVSAANNHASTCAGATPEERRAIARLDMRRWAKLRQRRDAYSPQQMVNINFRSRGYGNEPVFDDPALKHFGSSLASAIEARQRPDHEDGLDPKGESATAGSGDAQTTGAK